MARREDSDSGGGKMGAAAGDGGAKGPTYWKDGRSNGTARAGKRRVLARTRNGRATGNGNVDRLALEVPSPGATGCWGLTLSSSATEAGEVKAGTRNRPHRQPAFAGAHG